MGKIVIFDKILYNKSVKRTIYKKLLEWKNTKNRKPLRLIGAGLLIKVKITNSGEIPFEAFAEENRFK
jgi:hypothetical protein